MKPSNSGMYAETIDTDSVLNFNQFHSKKISKINLIVSYGSSFSLKIFIIRDFKYLLKHIKRDSEWNTFSNLKPNM